MLLVGDVPSLQDELLDRIPEEPRERTVHWQELSKPPHCPVGHANLNICILGTPRENLLKRVSQKVRWGASTGCEQRLNTLPCGAVYHAPR